MRGYIVYKQVEFPPYTTPRPPQKLKSVAIKRLFSLYIQRDSVSFAYVGEFFLFCVRACTSLFFWFGLYVCTHRGTRTGYTLSITHTQTQAVLFIYPHTAHAQPHTEPHRATHSHTKSRTQGRGHINLIIKVPILVKTKENHTVYTHSIRRVSPKYLLSISTRTPQETSSIVLL